ncbi:MAG: gamma-glutamyltransferase, partial [Mariprofundus sp.]
EMLAIEGINEMYHGDLARAIVSACSPHGLLGMDDMRAEQVTIRKPLSTALFGGTLLTNPAPSCGGLLISFAACLLELLLQQDDMKQIDRPVLLAEALRASSRIRKAGLDARMHQQNVAAHILNHDQLQTQLAIIRQRLGRDPNQQSSEAATEPDNRHGSTTHISIVDKNGMAVALTSSNGEGSGIVVPGTGIHLNNMLGEEDINPLGFHALPAGTSLSSMMAPSVFLKNGHLSAVLGSGGSNRLRGAIFQVLARHIMQGENIEAAVHAPRLHNEGGQLEVEPDFLADSDKEQLMQLGWRLREWQNQSIYFGGVHAISCDKRGNLHGSGDPRRGGAVSSA